MTFEDVLAKLDKKTAARVKKASEVKMERLPYYSLGLTQDTGGFVRGHVHLVYGPKSSGKSLQLMQTIGMHQALDPNFVAGWIDAEGTFDPDFAVKLGVDTDRLLYSNDKSFGNAQNTAVAWVKAGIDFLAIDSISVLIPEAFLDKEEIKGADGQKQMGARAKSCGVLLNSIHYENDRTAVFLISQAKMNLGGLVASHMPDGGQAVNHGSTQIIKLSASGALKQQITGNVYVNGEVYQRPIGREVTYFVEKNKSGPAAGTGNYNMYYAGDDIGIDVNTEMVELAAKYKLIEKGATGWFTVNGQNLRGASAVIEFLNSDLDYYDELKSKVLSING